MSKNENTLLLSIERKRVHIMTSRTFVHSTRTYSPKSRQTCIQTDRMLLIVLVVSFGMSIHIPGMKRLPD